MSDRIVVAVNNFGGSAYYRTVLPFMYLRNLGYDVSFVNSMADPKAKGSALFYLQRQYEDRVLYFAKGLASANKPSKIALEFDDTFHEFPSDNPNAGTFGSGKQAAKVFEELCGVVDTLVVSTPELAEYYKKFNPKVHVCYNAIADETFNLYAPKEITGEPKREGQIRIGWAGSAFHSADFDIMVKPLAKVMRDNPQVRFVFIGADYRKKFDYETQKRMEYVGNSFLKRKDGTKLEPILVDNGQAFPLLAEMNIIANKVAYHEWPTVSYYRLLRDAKLDIAIAPLANLTFNRQKSYLKAIEYGMLGVPAILSRFGPYSQFLHEAAQTDFPLVARGCASEREWATTLQDLIDSAQERRNLARSNLNYVRASHLMSHRIGAWVDVLESLSIERKVAA